MIGALKVFGQMFIMTEGGPADSTLSMVLYLYNIAFRYGQFRFGYASALAWFLAVFIFVVALISFRLSREKERMKLRPDQAPRRAGQAACSYLRAPIVGERAQHASFRFLWVVLSSLKPHDELYSKHLTFLPHAYTLSNYTQMFERMVGFGLYYRNSVLVSFGTVVLTLFVGSLAAYSLSRFRFKGDRFLLLLFLGTMMIPGEVGLIGQYELLSAYRLLNTLTGLTLSYSAFSLALTIFIMHTRLHRGTAGAAGRGAGGWVQLVGGLLADHDPHGRERPRRGRHAGLSQLLERIHLRADHEQLDR